MLKFLSVIVIVCIAFLFIECSPAMIGSTVRITSQVAKSEAARSKAQSLKKDTITIKEDTINYASYYIYRSGSFVGSALSCLVYDNNEYVAIANLKTFTKVDNVVPGDHIFTSKVDSKKSVKIHFDPGRTYIIQVLASTTIKEGVIFMMDQERIKKEISKGNFFNDKFTEEGLKIEDISFNDYFASKK
jgi:hypothetical protein